MTSHRHRRRMIVLLVVSLALLTWLVWGMVTDLRSRPVSYRVQHIEPVNQFLCPGDVLRYEVELVVTQVPAILHVVESWCVAGPQGVCMTPPSAEYNLPLLTPRNLYAIASRTMPESRLFTAGAQVEFHHASSDGKTTTGPTM